MYKTDSWEIVVPEGKQRIFLPEDIQLVRGKSIEYTPELKRYIEAKWNSLIEEKKKKGHPLPKNGSLVRVSRMPFINSDNKIELHLGPTNYKEHIATNFPSDSYSRSLTYDQNANVLNSMALLLSKDDYLVYSIRGNTATFAGNFSGFGVALNSHEEILKTGAKYLYDWMKNAILDEINAPESKLDLNLHGFAYIKTGFHAPLWIARSNLDKDEIEEYFNSRNKQIAGSNTLKYTGIGFVSLEEKIYLEFMKRKEVIDIIKPLLYCLGTTKWKF